ncbi:hypothetical protein BJX63DRAFT_400799 [Aspergillus granulosus]|uniref:Uncharacterized protein n=1 Tax=Aspergillus granulosus TaxID=176169 RepID=A0ABR4H638_9EURO
MVAAYHPCTGRYSRCIMARRRFVFVLHPLGMFGRYIGPLQGKAHLVLHAQPSRLMGRN